MASLPEGQEPWPGAEQEEHVASWETRHIFYFALFQFPSSPWSFDWDSARDATQEDPKCSSVVVEVLTVQLWKSLCLIAQQGKLFIHFESKIFWEKLENLNIPNEKKKKSILLLYPLFLVSELQRSWSDTYPLPFSRIKRNTLQWAGLRNLWFSFTLGRRQFTLKEAHTSPKECMHCFLKCLVMRMSFNYMYVKWTLKTYLKFWKPQPNPPMPTGQTHILCNILSFFPFQRPRGSRMSFMIRRLDLRNSDLTLCCKYLFIKRGRDDSQHFSKYMEWSCHVWRGKCKTFSDIFQRQGKALLITTQSSPMCFWWTPQNTWNILFRQIQIHSMTYR